MKTLDFSINQLEDTDGILVKSCKSLKQLEVLNLRHNNIDADSSESLLFLAKEKNLLKLQVSCNMVRVDFLAEIDKICKRNQNNKSKRGLEVI